MASILRFYHRLAPFWAKATTPSAVLRLLAAMQSWLGWGSVVLLAIGLVWSLLVAPPDYQQGEAVRIMFLHVPCAWLALAIYSMMAIMSAMALIWRHNLAFITIRAMAPVGAVFAFLCLFTGAIWGKPMWGTWWVWDARLTSMLILWFFYLGYLALLAVTQDRGRGERAAAILALVGGINVPIVKYSVDWWHSLHQPASILRLGGPRIAAEILAPLLLMIVAMTVFALYVICLNLRRLLIERKNLAARLRQNLVA
ncbi:MAG: heme ABC transporter permease CcmC [Candidatus Symbiobacter sp.]|nr:heme ABC transporter permease CcmC [Candidatus Symbiobacter sp.]